VLLVPVARRLRATPKQHSAEPSIRGRGSPIQSDDPAGRPSARTVLVRSDFMIGFRIGCHTVYDALLGIVITASHAMAVPPKTLVFMRFGVRFCGQNFQY
jgi:hypothetical protein